MTATRHEEQLGGLLKMLIGKSGMTNDELAWEAGMESPEMVAVVRATGSIASLRFDALAGLINACGYEIKMDFHKMERNARYRHYRRVARGMRK